MFVIVAGFSMPITLPEAERVVGGAGSRSGVGFSAPGDGRVALSPRQRTVFTLIT
ncbi:hypothetical protein OHA21_15545 [Actinoplanes sp. NBC_00393]|uniref:hypothetical protein n=1 Tax=Actinoplanes sp. NBC_00393 TaxID=2975953 RepID=UPI002E1BA2B9